MGGKFNKPRVAGLDLAIISIVEVVRGRPHRFHNVNVQPGFLCLCSSHLSVL